MIRLINKNSIKEMTPWPVEPVHPISKSADGTLSEALLTEIHTRQQTK